MSTAQLSDQQVLELGAKLRSARETQGKDLSESAFRIALSPSQLRALESGDRRPFYSTHYFLQAVDRYANFLGVTLAELASYRAASSSTAVVQQQEDPEPRAYVIDDDLPVEANNQPLPRNINVSAAGATSPLRSAPSERKRPAMAVLAIGAAVIVLSAVLTMKDSAAPPAPTPVPTPVAATAESPPAAATPVQVTEPAPAPAPVAEPPKPAMANAASSVKDARIESSVNAWVQIVSKSGEKSNLRIGAGESFEFASSETAAVVIGQPEKATLTVRGKAVDLRQYASSKDGSSRALVIIGDIRN